MVLEPEPGGARAVDVGQLLAEARALYDRGRFRDAAARYALVLATLPAADITPALLYDAALSSEGAGDLGQAAARYREALLHAPVGKLALDARFRLGFVEEQREAWAEAEIVFSLLVDGDLTPPDRVEALVHRGVARQAQDNLVEAERDYRDALRVYRDHRDHPRLRALGAVSRAQFQIGEIYRTLFKRIRFRLPLEAMERAWVEKATLFLKAQRAFLDTVRLPNEYWAVAGGQRLGLLFEEMVFDLLDAEVPPALDPETRTVYEEELRRTVRPYVERAVDLYETNLEISARLGQDSDWVRKTREHLVRLRELLAQHDAVDAP